MIRRAMWILLLGGIMTVVGAWFSAKLYRNLRTDMEELLPTTARSVLDLQRARNRLRSTQSLGIIVFSKNTNASRRFITDLARLIPKRDGEDVDRVEYRIDRELKFFGRKKALYIDTSDLRKIRDYIRDRIEYEKKLYNPLNIFSGEEIPEPRLSFGGLRKKYSNRVSAYTRFKGGYYATPDQRIRAALVYLRGPVGVGVAKRVTGAVKRAVAELNPRSYSPDMQVRYAGDVEDFVEENQSLISDLLFSTVVVLVLVSLAMIVYYRDLKLTLALLVSLFAGTLWTFGISYFLEGYLNANSAFLGSIVVGNGINFGIIFLARYLEERRGGNFRFRSLSTTIRYTSSATLTAALAAGLSYGSLAFTRFRGFHQFGVIGLIGMILCWISAFTLMPALISIIDRRARRRIAPKVQRQGVFSAWVAVLVRNFSKTILFLSFVAVFISSVAVITYRGEIIQTDTTKLRDRKSMQSGSGYNSKYLDEVFGRYISPLVIMADSPRDMVRIENRIKAYQERNGRASLIANVYSLRDFVPPDQAEKVRILKQIRKILKPSVVAKMSARDRRRVHKFMPKRIPKPFGVRDLPPLVLDRFKLKNGKIGDLVIVEPIMDKVALANGDNQYRLIHALRSAVDAVKPGTPVVGTLPITVDMYQSVRQDGPKATVIALISVILLVIVLFRKPRAIALTLFTLILGVSWLMGLIFGFDFKINFLNFIALPITFGIGVDYGVNIVQRYRSEGRGGILTAILGTGSAVALASLTTIIGYGSLLLAGNQAFFSFGRLAILGEVTTLAAALLSLPAYLYWRDRIRARSLQVLSGEEISEQKAPVRIEGRSGDRKSA